MVKNLQKQLSIASPTECQSSSIPLLAQNLDVVIAAETGSGKTYAYAISIVSDVLKRKEIERREEVSALIMCPNAHLCDQVKKTIDILTLPDDDGDNDDKPPLVRTVALTPDRGLPSSFPDIIVCTPARAEQDVFDWREGSWRNGAFSPYVKFIRTVVLDEADMLLGGGYARKVRNCFDVLFREEKLAATRGFYKTFEDESEITNKTRTKETLTSEWKNDLDRDAEASMEQNWRKDHDFDDDDDDDDEKKEEEDGEKELVWAGESSGSQTAKNATTSFARDDKTDAAEPDAEPPSIQLYKFEDFESTTTNTDDTNADKNTNNE